MKMSLFSVLLASVLAMVGLTAPQAQELSTQITAGGDNPIFMNGLSSSLGDLQDRIRCATQKLLAIKACHESGRFWRTPVGGSYPCCTTALSETCAGEVSVTTVTTTSSTTYTAPGSYSFTVPTFTTMNVTVLGAGGGGGGAGNEPASPGTTGGTSSFNGSLIASGGTGGSISPYEGINGDNGQPGGASGGDTNTAGGGAAGGNGGTSGLTLNRAGSGGAGGKVIKAYSSTQLSSGVAVNITIGSGGTGGTNSSEDINSTNGANGSVEISWQSQTTSGTTTVLPEGNICSSTCETPWGGTISYGESVTAYAAASVTSPATCQSQARSCTNGHLSGSYTAQTCTVTAAPTCNLPWGGTITDGQSVTAYATSSADSTACQSQTRSCASGTLSGSYSYQSCSVTCGNPSGFAWIYSVGGAPRTWNGSSCVCPDGYQGGAFAPQVNTWVCDPIPTGDGGGGGGNGTCTGGSGEISCTGQTNPGD